MTYYDEIAEPRRIERKVCNVDTNGISPKALVDQIVKAGFDPDDVWFETDSYDHFVELAVHGYRMETPEEVTKRVTGATKIREDNEARERAQVAAYIAKHGVPK